MKRDPKHNFFAKVSPHRVTRAVRVGCSRDSDKSSDKAHQAVIVAGENLSTFISSLELKREQEDMLVSLTMKLANAISISRRANSVSVPRINTIREGRRE